MPLNILNQYVPEEKIEAISTNDPTAAALSNHLLRSMFIAQHRAASVDGHQAVKALDGRCAGRANS